MPLLIIYDIEIQLKLSDEKGSEFLKSANNPIKIVLLIRTWLPIHPFLQNHRLIIARDLGVEQMGSDCSWVQEFFLGWQNYSEMR